MKFFAALFGILLLASACSTHVPRSIEGVSSITLERTGCLGSCPTYTVTLYLDGLVRLERRQAGQRKRIVTKKVSPESVQEVFATVERIGFWTMQDSYYEAEISEDDEVITLPPTDQPTRLVTVRVAGKVKTTKDYWGAPEELHHLEELIDSTAQISATE